MKRILPSVVFFAFSFLVLFTAHGQSRAISPFGLAKSHSHSIDRGTSALSGSFSFSDDHNPLPPSVIIPGADTLPISGRLEQAQSDGRALHNIQVDPSNPNNVHAVIMELSSNWVGDSNLLSRRVYYTFSSDGGHTWKTPVMLTNVKTGFPCMILYNRGGQYVPIIAAHRFMLPLNRDTANTDYECALWVEKGNPGDGNFQMTECGTTGTYGSLGLGAQGILWPYIGVSPKGDTVYMVGSVSSNSVDYIRYGTFALDATGTATWNGWNQEIGAQNNNDGNAGYVASGDYVLRVSPSGKVGLLWKQSDYGTPNTSLYFIESTDGGNTWPQTFSPIEQIQDQNTQNGNDELYSGPWDGIDFFYNGENAKILWTSINELFPGDTGISDYPAFVSLHLYDMASGVDSEIVSSIAGDTTQYDLSAQMPTFNNTIDTETDVWFSYPTIAQSADPNIFAVFYQMFQLNDTVTLGNGGAHLYGSIYYQVTSDGGFHWTAPTPFRANSGAANTYGKIDFRWPEVSDWNGSSVANFDPTVMYGADTAAGTDVKNGTPEWDVVNFFRDSLALTFSGVSQNALVPSIALSNYPNPTTGSTTISFTLPQASQAMLTVTDMLGRSVATVMNQPMGAGMHTAVFNADNLADGVYRYTLEADGVSVSKSMTLVR